jgi:hypothetical protein
MESVIWSSQIRLPPALRDQPLKTTLGNHLSAKTTGYQESLSCAAVSAATVLRFAAFSRDGRQASSSAIIAAAIASRSEPWASRRFSKATASSGSSRTRFRIRPPRASRSPSRLFPRIVGLG